MPDEQNPSPKDQLSLNPGSSNEETDTQAPEPPEEVIWVGRMNWKHFAGTILIGIVAMILVVLLLVMAARLASLPGAIALWIGVGLVVVIAALIARKVIPGVFGRRYRLTSERLFIEKGILSRTIDQTELVRVDDVRVHKSMTNMIFHLGTVEITSTDASDGVIMIVGVEEPDGVAEAIRNHMRIRRKKSLFIENL